jgi:hypothetical protein
MTTLTNDMHKLATLADLPPVKAPELTSLEWLAMLPAVVAQLSPAQREEFVMQILQACDQAGVELAGCMADEFEAARGWR